MKHLLVTGNKMKSLYTRKKPLEKDPHTTLVVEIKCPFKGKDLDLKIAFLLPTVSREKMKMGIFFLSRIIYTISKFRLAWQFQVYLYK